MTNLLKRDVLEILQRADLAHHDDPTYVHLASALEAIRALPHSPAQGEGELREALEWIADRCPPVMFTDQHAPYHVHFEMAHDAGACARAALKQEGQG